MSQRVQKGSTVFRPVAKPRPRTGTESRQPSALPEPSAPGPAAAHAQDVPRASSVMPPPSTVPSRPPAVPSVTGTDASPGFGQETSPQASSFPSQSSTSDASNIPAPPAVRATARMPPMIGSSQRTSQRAAHIVPPVHIQSTPRNVPAAPLNVPSAHGSAHPVHGHSSDFSEFHPIPEHLSGLNGNMDDLPFTIDSSQIDPQLIADALGLSSLGSQGPPTNAIPIEQMHATDVSVTNSSLPHPSSGRPRDTVSPPGVTPQYESTNHDPGSVKRKRSKKAGSAVNEGTQEPTSKRRRTGPRSRTRPPSPPPFDPDADPGEDLDPTAVTMAALCDDTGRGRVSSKAAQIVSNHAAWRAANREKRARMKAVMEAKKYGRNLEEEEESSTPAKAAQEDAPAATTSRAATPNGDPGLSREGDDDAADKDEDDFDYNENLAVSQYNVQVRIGANGETIIDEDSLFVNRDEEHRTEDYTHVEESDFTKFVNSATYSKKLRGSRWSAEETELFYNALSQFGENYELISYVLPGRDRKACKNKFKTEDRKNPARITYCLNNRTPYDIATLSRMTGKDFSGPTPDIRAPTPVRSAELHADEPPPNPPSPGSPRVIRKKSKAPSIRDAGVEVIGSVDDFDKEDEPGAATSTPVGVPR
ncbi:hypothetical protein C8T65DRAFT_634376 [Cerioporus squamosus]|nr:hypothetical protein C8T65DRAFT_634376 [Cerioporus squamosus]